MNIRNTIMGSATSQNQNHHRRLLRRITAYSIQRTTPASANSSSLPLLQSQNQEPQGWMDWSYAREPVPICGDWQLEQVDRQQQQWSEQISLEDALLCSCLR